MRLKNEDNNLAIIFIVCTKMPLMRSQSLDTALAVPLKFEVLHNGWFSLDKLWNSTSNVNLKLISYPGIKHNKKKLVMRDDKETSFFDCCDIFSHDKILSRSSNSQDQSNLSSEAKYDVSLLLPDSVNIAVQSRECQNYNHLMHPATLFVKADANNLKKCQNFDNNIMNENEAFCIEKTVSTCSKKDYAMLLPSNDTEWSNVKSLPFIPKTPCCSNAVPSVIVSDCDDEDSLLNLTSEDSLYSEKCLLVTLDDITESTQDRRLSTCSTCSNASSVSSLSWDDDQSFNDSASPSIPSTPTKKKISAWKKVKSALHLVSFIHTYRKKKYPWIQLAGHQGNFKAGHQGTILKKLCGREEICLRQLMKDSLQPFVPQFKNKVYTEDGETYLELEDLLYKFDNPCIMDVKMGTRTYLEDELIAACEKPKLRKDMYERMMKIDSREPFAEEHKLQAITKSRYMIWRETISSTSTLGFRIEGIKLSDGKMNKDFKVTKSRDQVICAIQMFLDGFSHCHQKYLQRLNDICLALKNSAFFARHEFIGSSLLFVHDLQMANIWLIDFAKTSPISDDLHITHQDKWQLGNHEDGYLTGLLNIMDIFKALQGQKL